MEFAERVRLFENVSDEALRPAGNPAVGDVAVRVGGDDVDGMLAVFAEIENRPLARPYLALYGVGEPLGELLEMAP